MPVVVAIDGETHKREYLERSPLNRCVLLSHVKEIYDSAPSLVVIDLDLSPALTGSRRKAGVTTMGGDPGSVNLDTAEEIPSSLKLAAKQLNWLPMTAEVMYGERSHKEETNILARDHKLGKKYYPIADKMLGEILSKDQKHEYGFKLFILKNDGEMRLQGQAVFCTSTRGCS